jgi:hypothetical protein
MFTTGIFTNFSIQVSAVYIFPVVITQKKATFYKIALAVPGTSRSSNFLVKDLKALIEL